jgi:hypothetical protein
MKRFSAVCANLRINGPKAGVENGFRVAYGQIYCVDHRQAHEDAEIFVKAFGGDALHLVQREFRRPHDPTRKVAGVMEFKDADQAKAVLEGQRVANEYLVAIRLCAPGPGCAAGQATVAAAASDEESLPPFVNGQTTAKEVKKQLGRPRSENHNPDGASSTCTRRATGDLRLPVR